MVNIIGILIVILGFSVPFLSSGRLPSVFFFWTGFLFLLRPNKYFRSIAGRIEWARIGLFAHVIGNFLALLCFYLVIHTAFPYNHYAAMSYSVFEWFVSPVSSLTRYLFPSPRIEMPNGGVLFVISYMWSGVTSFLDVVVYLFVGTTMGAIFLGQVHRSKGAGPD